MACHGHQCSNTRLINAHIIPQGFGRLIRTRQGPLLKATAGGISPAAPQLGEYDPDLLCADCDQHNGATQATKGQTGGTESLRGLVHAWCKRVEITFATCSPRAWR
jgi:hypothetical protein